MIRPRLSPAVVLMAGLLGASFARLAQERPVVRVPEGNGKPVLTDGIFSPG
jgi:hypothetical protein